MNSDNGFGGIGGQTRVNPVLYKGCWAFWCWAREWGGLGNGFGLVLLGKKQIGSGWLSVVNKDQLCNFGKIEGLNM